MRYAAPHRSFVRQAVPRELQRKPRSETLPAPTRGWVTNTNLVDHPKQSAIVLDNWFPESDGLTVRGGQVQHATIGSAKVERLMGYAGLASSKLFAADETDIYDITTPADAGVAPAASVTGRTSGYWSSSMFTTSGTAYLVAVNGADHLMIYNGTQWVPIADTDTVQVDYDNRSGAFTQGLVVTDGTSGANGTIAMVIDNGDNTGTLFVINVAGGAFGDGNQITDTSTGVADVDGTPATVGTAITSVNIGGDVTDSLNAVWSYRDRLMFAEIGSLNAHYLPVDSIAGALGQLNFTGVFKQGGTLLMGGTWSIDSGSGPDDYCVFISEKGEAAVYKGLDPSGTSPGDFDLVGVYEVGEPLGKNGTMRAGGDLLVLTKQGVVPLSLALQRDPAALSIAAVSVNIEPDWKTAVRDRAGNPWEVAKWDSKNRAYFSLPKANTTDDALMFVANLETGAWCRYVGWDATALCVFDDQFYFGDADGEIWLGESGGTDNGSNIEATCVYHAEHFKAAGITKTLLDLRGVFTSSVSFTPKLSASADYTIVVPSPPSVAVIGGEGWDLSLWDTGLWDDPASTFAIASDWFDVGVTGFAIHPQVQITSNASVPMTAKLVAMDALLEVGLPLSP